MRVLLIGSGGREHALAWALAASPLMEKLFVAPGNPGIAPLAELVPIGMEDIAALVTFAQENAIDLVIPGPEAPLVAGITDAMEAAGIECCGPTAAAAQLEGSKAFTKDIAEAAGVPTARWERFIDAGEAHDFISRRSPPIVVKADGLASGKGVVVAQTMAEADDAIDRFIPHGPIVIEECLVGEEVSLFALCDGANAVFLGTARDHKRVGDGDTGPNTGGMGAISPVPGFDPAPAMDRIIRPVLAEMASRDMPFRGILYAGLMLTEDGASLIEFNVRFGDPECQVLMARLQSDLLPALLAACQGELDNFDLRFRPEAACGVVMAARGYPNAPESGSVIAGLDHAAAVPGAMVFHAGTAWRGEQVVASGGRVLTLVGTGLDAETARQAAYAAVAAVQWPEGFNRSDIGL
ncbi:phosphoribosylamine--glycine ligase [Acidisphaera sp. L21]|uniref:phosphoribosylamine--glycine ligase n=1 Tax=Acidisphaera sp. L21 TaxID=1641851 RepID=UPI00131AAB7C|nr:phosphoribosylamine--glycine ligase [Acidisphaera sp. L21]